MIGGRPVGIGVLVLQGAQARLFDLTGEHRGRLEAPLFLRRILVHLIRDWLDAGGDLTDVFKIIEVVVLRRLDIWAVMLWIITAAGVA